MTHQDETISEWLARCILPYEPMVRARLRTASLGPHEIDDVVQEAYARIAAVENFKAIASPSSYFLSAAKNILSDGLRRSRVVRLENHPDILNIRDQSPSPEQQTSAREELARLDQVVASLPTRCRNVFVLRKIEGVSQKEIARRLGMSEHTVEAHIQRGLRLVLERWAAAPTEQAKPGKGRRIRTLRMPRP